MTGINKTNKKGRPTLYKDKMIRRTYQITAAQDKIIKKLSDAAGKSQSGIIRAAITHLQQ